MIPIFLACIGLVLGPVLFIFGMVLMNADTEPSALREDFHSHKYKRGLVLRSADKALT